MPQTLSQIRQHLLCGVSYFSSDHCDERPEEKDISLLVIHGISLPPDQFSGDAVKRFFLGQLDGQGHPFFQTIKGLRVSAHLFIRRSGEVMQFVPFNKRAWHAGVSCFNGRERCNDFSIGIELEGNDVLPYEEEQYQCLIHVTQLLLQHYPKISKERIVGHCDIAPGRKTDPGPHFDWARYRHGLRESE